MIKKGIYLSLLTALISGFSIFINKLFVSQSDPLVFTTIRNSLVGVMLTCLLFISGRSKSLKSLKWKDWRKLAMIGVIGGSIPFWLFFAGLAKIGAVQANLIHKTLFVWVALLALPLLKEKLHPIQIVGYGLIMVANVAFGGLALSVNFGLSLVLAATVLWAIENVIAKVVLRSIPTEIVSWARIILGLPVLLTITIMSGKSSLLLSLSNFSLFQLVTSSLFLVAYMLTWYKALSLAPATLVTSILVIAPLVTNLLTAMFINHQLPKDQWQSALILTLGLMLVLTKVMVPRVKKIYGH